jgi:RNA polymerase sigma factor (sigma-70 family)
MTSWPETRMTLIRQLADPANVTAWLQFEKTYQPAIYRFARSRGLQQADALDVVQEVMLAVHRQAAHWTPTGRNGSFRAWLGETVRRTTLQLLRLRTRIGVGLGGSSVGTALDAIPAHDDRELNHVNDQRWRFFCAAAVVESEVCALNWRAFWMTAVEGKSAEEVATILDTRVGTVYSAKCRVMARIRRVAAAQQKDASNGYERGTL